MGNRNFYQQNVDYREGTWTPTLTFETPGDLSVAYTLRVGHFTKVGRLVTLHGTVLTSAFTHSTASGSCIITGIPFAPSPNCRAFGSVVWQGITKANYTHVNSAVVAGGNFVSFGIHGSGQSALGVSAADMPSGGGVLLEFTVTYFV